MNARCAHQLHPREAIHSGKCLQATGGIPSRSREMKLIRLLAALTLLVLPAGCSGRTEYDVILRNGMLYDGSGLPPVRGDLAITGDRIAAIGPLSGAGGKTEIDVAGSSCFR